MIKHNDAGASGALSSDSIFFKRMIEQGYLAGSKYLVVRDAAAESPSNTFRSAAERMLAADPATHIAFLSTAPCTLAVAKSGVKLPVLLDDLAQLTGSSVPRVRGFDTARGRKLRSSAVFVEGAGCLCRAADAYEAHALAMVIEKACMAFIGSSFLGGGKRIPFHEALLMRFIYKFKYGRKRG